MHVDPAAILALLSEQTATIASLRAENQALRAALDAKDKGSDHPQQ